MVEPEQMSLPERWKYLRLLQPRYASGNRRQRSDLLDEAEQVTGRHRKSLIRLLRGSLERKRRSRQRGRRYGPQMVRQAHHAVEYAVRRIARSLDFPVCRAPAAGPARPSSPRSGTDGPSLSQPPRTAAVPGPAGATGAHQCLDGRADGAAHAPGRPPTPPSSPTSLSSAEAPSSLAQPADPVHSGGPPAAGSA